VMLSQNVTEQVGWAAPPQISRCSHPAATGVARTDRYLAGSRGARRESTWSQHACVSPPRDPRKGSRVRHCTNVASGGVVLYINDERHRRHPPCPPHEWSPSRAHVVVNHLH
jgi:hypothetical protein